MAAETECRQENIAPGSTDFLLRYCVAVNKELNPLSVPMDCSGNYRPGMSFAAKRDYQRASNIAGG